MKRQPWRSAARIAAVVTVAAGLATSVTACSGGASRAGVASAASSVSHSAPASPVAFSRCMRSHGVSNFPDPDSSATIPKVGPQQLGISSSQFQRAQSACANLLEPAEAQVQQTLSGMFDFAQCMRSHGVHDWPDPSTDSDGQQGFDLHGRINPDSAQISRTSDECSHLLHPAPGQNGTVLCNGIGEDGCHHYGPSIS
jgi:hypothetical protein